MVKKAVGGQPVSLTDLFGHLLGNFILKEVCVLDRGLEPGSLYPTACTVMYTSKTLYGDRSLRDMQLN
jgi:hypothetical protein